MHTPGTFAHRQTEILLDSADPAGLCPAAAAKFLHTVGQQILMIFAHIGISQIFPELVKAPDFFADLVRSHASTHPDRFIIQSSHTDRGAPGLEMMNGSHVERLGIVLDMFTGQWLPAVITLLDR